MRALQFRTYGGPEVLEWAEAPEPHAGPGAGPDRGACGQREPDRLEDASAGACPVASRWRAPATSAMTPPAWWTRSARASPGSRWVMSVLGRGQNTQAEYAVLDAWAAKPPSIDWAVAAAAGVAGETGERGLRLLEVEAGDTLFVDGGAGGVGAVAVQMALARGARVIASASEANHDYLREIGATPVLYGDGVADRVRAAAGGPVDAVFDVAGQTPVEDLISLVPEPSQVVSIANYAAGAGRSPGDRWRRRQPAHAGPGRGRRAAGTERAGDQGADLPVRPRRRGLPHQPGRPRPRKARPRPLKRHAA